MKTGMLRAGRHIPPETAAYGKGTPLPMQALRHGMRGNSRPLVMDAAQLPLCRPRTCLLCRRSGRDQAPVSRILLSALKGTVFHLSPGQGLPASGAAFPSSVPCFFPKTCGIRVFFRILF